MKLQVIVYNGRVEFVTGFQLLLPVFSYHDFVGRHFRISISRMERDFLSGEISSCENAAVLRGAILNHRDQLHLLPYPEQPRRLEVGIARLQNGFRFGLKAPQKVTHIAKLRNCEELLDIFQRVVSGLGSKLGPVLFQLPPNFKKDAALLNEFLTQRAWRDTCCLRVSSFVLVR